MHQGNGDVRSNPLWKQWVGTCGHRVPERSQGKNKEGRQDALPAELAQVAPSHWFLLRLSKGSSVLINAFFGGCFGVYEILFLGTGTDGKYLYEFHGPFSFVPF